MVELIKDIKNLLEGFARFNFLINLLIFGLLIVATIKIVDTERSIKKLRNDIVTHKLFVNESHITQND